MAIEEYGPKVLGWIKKPEHEKVLAAANANLARAKKAGEGVPAAEKYAKRVQASYNSKYGANRKDTMTARERAAAARLGKDKEFISPPPPRAPTVPKALPLKLAPPPPPPSPKSRAPKTLDTRELNKAELDTLQRNLAEDEKKRNTQRAILKIFT